MLWFLIILFVVMWALGMVSSYTLGGLLHLLLVFALIALIFQLVTGRRDVV